MTASWLSFNKLNTISDTALSNIETIFKLFDVDYRETGNSYCACCPIHGNSDNPNAFVMYKNSGAWICNTHGCHNIFRKTPIGFIRGVLSARKLGWASHKDVDKVYGFESTIDFINNLANEAPLQRIKRGTIAKSVAPVAEKRFKIENFASQIDCPATYYVNRGFSPDILKKHMVGLNKMANTPLSNRVLVPIFDLNKKFVIGCTARTVDPKCLVCDGYHKLGENCPDPKFFPKVKQKWAHSKNFQRTNYLYNYWHAKNEYDNYGKTIILVEGPSEVWKLDEAGYKNGMAIFGADLTMNQTKLIEALNPSKIITIMDSDDAGFHAEESCRKMLPEYKIESIFPSSKDLGEMTCEQVKQLLK